MSFEKLLEKLTTRNLIALSVTGMFLIVIGQMAFNPQQLIVVLTEHSEWVVTGAVIFGALIAKWTDIIQFYFRKPQSKESES